MCGVVLREYLVDTVRETSLAAEKMIEEQVVEWPAVDDFSHSWSQGTIAIRGRTSLLPSCIAIGMSCVCWSGFGV